MSTSTDFLPAWEAAYHIAGRCGGLSRAKYVIAAALREGLISAACEEWLLLNEDEESEEVASENELIHIDPEFWAQSAVWEADRLAFNWDDGDFQIEGPNSEFEYNFYGVHFPVAELEAIDLSAPVFEDVLSADSARRSPEKTLKEFRAKHWDWERAFAGLVKLADKDGLESLMDESQSIEARGGSKRLEEWFQEWFLRQPETKANAPSESELRKRANLVLSVLRDAEAEVCFDLNKPSKPSRPT